MSTDIIQHNASAPLAAYSGDVIEYARASQAANTTRAYRAAWLAFCDWCDTRGLPSLPASDQTAAAWLTSEAKAGRKASTLQVKRAAVSAAHRMVKAADPTTSELVRVTMKGINRTIGTAKRGKAPVTADVLRQLVLTLDRSTLPGMRDAALLLLGFGGAFRRSELVALDVEDLRFGVDALRVTVRRSKTDQDGAGLQKTIPGLEDEAIDPAKSLRDWLDSAGISSGPVFCRVDRWGCVGQRLTDQTVSHIVKRCAALAGLDPRQFAGHSLRSGYVTSAVLAGAEALDVAEQTGHRSLDTLRGYVRSAGRASQRATRLAFGQAI